MLAPFQLATTATGPADHGEESSARNSLSSSSIACQSSFGKSTPAPCLSAGPKGTRKRFAPLGQSSPRKKTGHSLMLETLLHITSEKLGWEQEKFAPKAALEEKRRVEKREMFKKLLNDGKSIDDALKVVATPFAT
ncbi:hypothetical protein K3495_g3926 [Podosphaera aphanis]|nr:hypothetical protein K3495_g3926 [Podosphaera aphanis]